jgi:transcriptional regulator with XRE-family HTH domain
MNIKLRNLREERKISQTVMAKALHISQPQYQRKEVGEAAFTVDELETFADLLNVSVEDIKDKDTLTQNNYNQKGGIAQVMYYIADKLVDEYKEINNLLKSELIEYRKKTKG